MKSIKFWVIMIFLLSIYIFFCAYSYVQAISSDLQSSILRLHVIANSNSSDDQNLKYLVRDNLLKYMNKLCSNCTSKEEAIIIAKSHLNDLSQIAKNTIIQEGYSYNVEVELGKFEFPTKKYGDISFPAGNYDALRVKIGESKGNNWWCVMFPPLCFVDISSGTVPEDSKKILEKELTEEEFALVSENSCTEIDFKFKLLELFSDIIINTAKK